MTKKRKKAVLKEMFNNDIYGVGAGISAFYQVVCRKYLNIQSSEVGYV